MCLICCHAKIHGTPSGSGVPRGSGDHYPTHWSTKGRLRLRRAERGVQTDFMVVAEYSQPFREVLMVCDHPQQIIDLEQQVTDLQTKQFLPPQCDRTKLQQQIQTLTNEWDEAWKRPTAAGTNQELQQVLNVMTRDARQSGEEVQGLMMQLANALALAARAAPAAPQAPEDRGPKFPDSLDFSELDQTELRGWIAQLRMVI